MIDLLRHPWQYPFAADRQTVIVHSPYLLFVWRACGAKRDISILYEEIMTPKGVSLETFTVDSKVAWTCLYKKKKKKIWNDLFSFVCNVISHLYVGFSSSIKYCCPAVRVGLRDATLPLVAALLHRPHQRYTWGNVRLLECYHLKITLHCGQVTSVVLVMIEGVLQHI